MRIVFTAAVVCVVLGGRADAQEAGAVGITIAHPSSVGLIWHATDRVAIRPEFAFSRATSETESTFGGVTLSGTSDGWSVGTGVSALFYVRQWDRVRAYLSPRFSYARTRGTSVGPSSVESRATTRTHGWSASYGAQYLPNDRFGVFGEVGLGGTSARTSSSASGSRGTGHTWGTRAGLGAVVYF